MSATRVDEDKLNSEQTTISQQKALKLLKSPDYFSEFLDAVRRGGLVGEKANACVLHVIALSAATKRPGNAIVKGRSSSGKNFLVSRVLKLCPPDVVREITSSSKTAFNYSGTSFRNSIVYVQELEHGADNPMRLLISESKLVRIVTTNQGGELTTKRFETDGPIASISTTTRSLLEVDDETRNFSVPVDETPAQTKRILEAYLSQTQPLTDREISVWRCAYKLVAQRAALPIEIPEWFALVAGKVYARDVAARRYFPAFVEACKMVSLIRSFQSERNSSLKLIRVNFTDLAVAARLFGPVLDQSIAQKDERNLETRSAIEELFRRSGEAVRTDKLAEYLKISEDRAYSRIRMALDAGAILRANDPEKTNVKRYRAAPPAKFLPSTEELFELIPEIKSVRFVDPLTGKEEKLS